MLEPGSQAYGEETYYWISLGTIFEALKHSAMFVVNRFEVKAQPEEQYLPFNSDNSAEEYFVP